MTTDQRPSDIQDYTGVRDTPLVLGAILGMLAVGTLSHALLAGVRRRYRDLALLKTLGLVRSQLLRVVCWQATTLATAALLAGVPLGVLAGRWAWLVFARSAGVASQADVPVPAGPAGHPGDSPAGQPAGGRARLDRGPGARRDRAAERVMEALWLTLRAGLRHRWQPVLGLALLLGVIGGVVLTAVAGAQRTDTAYPRLLRAANASEVLLISSQYTPAAYFAGLRRLPQVASLSEASLYDAVLPARHGPSGTVVETFSSPDDSFGVTGDRVRILSGRRFSRDDPRAVMIDQQLAAREHLHPGGMLRIFVVPGQSNPELSRAREMSFRVSAIVVFDNQIVPATKVNAEPMALFSPLFAGTRLALSASYGAQAAVRLRPGASMPALLRGAAMLARRYPATQAPTAVNLADEVATTERAIRPQAVALALFAALAGLIALVVIGQLLSRQLSLDSAEFPILRTLGMTPRGLTVLSLARLAVITGAGGLAAAAIAVAASPLMPIGPARLAEPHPGLDVNLVVLGTGCAAIIALPLLLLAPAAWRNAAAAAAPFGVAEPAGPARASRLGAALGRSGPVTGSLGVRMAFEPGRGRTAVPVRSALAGTTVAVAAVIAAFVFGTSLIHLVETPRLYGQDWQQQLDLQFGGVHGSLLGQILARQKGLASYAEGDYGQVTIAGQHRAGDRRRPGAWPGLHHDAGWPSASRPPAR